jgi:pyrroloquinoline quinone biosynthesis protein E
VRDAGLREIWFDSEGFNRYRGTGWMKEPCASCEHKERDLGGCRCQAWLIAQDAEAADPVCVKSPHHGRVLEAVERAEVAAATRVVEHPLVFRDPLNSRRLAKTSA